MKISVKNINFVGAACAALAIIFSLFPFYYIKPTTFFNKFDSNAEIYNISKNLIGYNIIGVIMIVMLFVTMLLYIINSTEKIRFISVISSIGCLFLLIISTIVGNSEIKEVILTIDTMSKFSGYEREIFIKCGFTAFFYIEIVTMVILSGSYWINEMIIRRYVFKDAYKPLLKPLTSMVNPHIMAETKASAPGQEVNQIGKITMAEKIAILEEEAKQAAIEEEEKRKYEEEQSKYVQQKLELEVDENP